MAMTIEDLKPKNFTINVKGLALQCRPPRLADALLLSKLGDIFQNPGNFTKEDLQQAEADVDSVIESLIPELKGVELDLNGIMTVISQVMDNIEPDDNKELKNKGVSFGDDPKTGKNG